MVEAHLIVVDVGGTTLSAACVDPRSGRVGSVHERPSSESESSQEIIATLVDMLIVAAERCSQTSGAVVCMPAPFDYVEGTSRMRHKFADLYDVPLGPVVSEAIGLAPLFVNDADAAAVGVWRDLGALPGAMGVVTLGTGVGTSFLRDGVPQEPVTGNELWCTPYEDGIFEDYVSAASLRDAYEAAGGPAMDVQSIATRGQDGDPKAIMAFRRFGQHLGRGVAAHYGDLDAARVVFSGKISRSWVLFGTDAQAAFVAAGGTADLSASTLDNPALLGGATIGGRGFDVGNRV